MLEFWLRKIVIKADRENYVSEHQMFKVFLFSIYWGLSGRVLDSRPRGRVFEPHRRHFVVVLEQDTFILAQYWFNPGRPVPV